MLYLALVACSREELGNRQGSGVSASRSAAAARVGEASSHGLAVRCRTVDASFVSSSRLDRGNFVNAFRSIVPVHQHQLRYPLERRRLGMSFPVSSLMEVCLDVPSQLGRSATDARMPWAVGRRATCRHGSTRRRRRSHLLGVDRRSSSRPPSSSNRVARIANRAPE
jgi:hypothetical protein